MAVSRALLLCALTLPAAARALPIARSPEPRVFAVVRELARAASEPLWPGFDPRNVPFEIYDGERTWLFHHPAPPPEFEPSAEDGVRVASGRHTSVRANTSIDLGGVPTATVILDSSVQPRRQAALLVHEIFHVFQAKRHPTWQGNEVELLSYPVDSAAGLALRRLESEALRRALSARDVGRAAAWAAAAVDLRRERFTALSAALRNYERGTELKEGLARYVETRAEGSAAMPIPARELPAQPIRLRAYASGCALALLLDRLEPDWKERIEENDRAPLDDLLAAALERRGVEAASFSAERRRQEKRRASRDVAALVRDRARKKRELEAAPGWRIDVIAQDEPLWPKAFDPWNMERVGAAEVLHTRWIKLGNGAGDLEVLDRPCLTLSAGSDPLFQGVRRAEITGLESPPTVSRTGDSLRVEAKGFELTARAASIEREGNLLRIKLNRTDDSSNH